MKTMGLRVGLVAFSKAGGELALKAKELAGKSLHAGQGNEIKPRERAFLQGLEQALIYVPQRLADSSEQMQGYEKAESLMANLFKVCHVIVCFGATGIAVRSMAPHLQNKYRDPAVLVCDEKGTFVISLLSGHVGGANLYAKQFAGLLQATPVITTASDTAGKFAVDSWAEEMHLLVGEPHMVKDITGKLLEGEPIGFFSDIPMQGVLPEELTENSECRWGICVSAEKKQPFVNTLHLVPKRLIVGVGCKKGTSEDALEQAWQKLCIDFQLNPRLIARVASIDLKLTESGLVDWIVHKKAEGVFYTAEELAEAKGIFDTSAFVEQITGVDNVCQRAAALAGGPESRCLVPKQKLSGITMAVYEEEIGQIVF